MNDEELEKYIKKIDANFESHLEKGTIEMSNEYYNSLEERMARLISQNEELKKEKYKLFIENNLMKQLLTAPLQYTYGVR